MMEDREARLRSEFEDVLESHPDLAEGAEEFIRMRLSEPTVAPAPRSKAFTQMAAGAETLERHLRTKPIRAAHSLYEQGRVMMQRGDERTAVKLAGDGLAIDEKGCLLMGTGQPGIAGLGEYEQGLVKASQRITKDDVLYVRACAVLSHILASSGDLEGAAKAASRGVKADPTNATMRYTRSSLYVRTQRIALAIEDLRAIESGKAVFSSVDNHDDARTVHRDMAKCFFALENRSTAIIEMRKYVGSTNPRETEILARECEKDPEWEKLASAMCDLVVYHGFEEQEACWSMSALMARVAAIEPRLNDQERRDISESKMQAQLFTCVQKVKPVAEGKKSFFSGDIVNLHGLDSEKGKALNGCRGTITGVFSERFRVELEKEVHGRRTYDILGRNLALHLRVEKCPICQYEIQDDPLVLSCSHKFCAGCLNREMRSENGMKKKCAICRTEISPWDQDRIIKKISMQKGTKKEEAPQEDAHEKSAALAVENALRAAAQKKGAKSSDAKDIINEACFQDYERRRNLAPAVDENGDFVEQRLRNSLLESDGSDDPVVRRACDVKKNTADKFGDGDQSPLDMKPGSPGADLEHLWAEGGNCHPWQRRNKYTAFFGSCAWGDVAEVKAHLRAATSEKATFELLERRESSLRKCPLMAAINCARVVPGSPDWPLNGKIHKPEPIAVAKLLIDSGCRLDARDVAGNTPLQLAAGSHATAQSLEIATLIVRKGGTKLLTTSNRLKQPLICTGITNNRGDVVTHLIYLGLDPREKINFGTPKSLLPREVAMMVGHHEMAQLLDEATRIRNQQDKANNKRACAQCGKSQQSGLLACGRCAAADYCSPNCQKLHWPQHKRTCKKKTAKK